MFLFLTAHLIACFDKPQDTGEDEPDITDSGDTDDTDDTSTTVGVLEGLDLVLTDAQGYSPVSERIALSFPSGAEFQFAGDCNSFFGEYTLNDNLFVVSGVGGTEMGCETQLMEEDEWLVSFFTSSPTFEVQDEILVLQSGDVTLTFRDRDSQIPSLPLENTLWRIDSYISGDIAMAMNLDNIPSVVFADGEIDLNTGCNSGMGQYTIDGDSITVFMDAYTDAICGDEIAQEAEGHVVNVFMGPTLSFSIRENSLTLLNGDLGLGAIGE